MERDLFKRRNPELLATLSHDIKVVGHWLTDDELASTPALTWDNNLDEISVNMRCAGAQRANVRDALIRAIGKFDLVVGSDVPIGEVDGIVANIAARLDE